MELNPYARFLANQDPTTVLAATPGRLHDLACQKTPEQIEAPIAPGKWSPREIVAHLADCEMAFSFRLRQTLSEDNPRIQPFDQAAWSTRYAFYDLPSGLALFAAARAWNLKLIQGLTPADLARQAIHPQRGNITFEIILQTMAGHDLNHLAQLEA